MNAAPKPLDLRRLRVLPLSERQSISPIATILREPDSEAPHCSVAALNAIRECARRVIAAREWKAGVILMYGAHLVKNGGQKIVISLLNGGWITHLATNGAGTIHDWELAFLGRTEESVRANVATGTFGAWDETGRWIQIALLAGALRDEGYGRSLGRFVVEDGVTLPLAGELEQQLRSEPAHPLAPARADLLQAILAHQLPAGRIHVNHAWKTTSLLAETFIRNIPMTVHPGVGYDIIANHPMFNGAAVGRAGAIDFALLGGSVDRLDGGVVLSVGSSVMAPQVFEKSLSCVNNLRLRAGNEIVSNHSFFVVDIQDAASWDWSRGEPPRDNPAYYLRFCKSFARMGGDMTYVQCDNVAFLHHLWARLGSRLDAD